MLTFEEMRNTPAKSEVYLIGPELLPKGGKLFLAAAEKTGKSFLLLNMAIALATGTHLWNGPFPIPRPLRVLYLDKELGYSRLRKRLLGIAPDPGPADRNIFFDSKNVSAVLSAEGHKEIIKLISQADANVVIYDPLSKFIPGADENNQADMTQALHYMDIIMNLTGTTSVVAHHLSKPSMAPRRGAQRMRGSTVLSADLDTYIEATRLNATHHRTRSLSLQFITRDEPVEDQYVKLTEGGQVEYLGLESPMKHGNAGRPKGKKMASHDDD